MSLPYYNNRSLAPISYVFPLFTGQSAGSHILQQDLYQIFLISFLVNASSFGGDPPSPCLRRTGKPRPYNWWWAVHTQTLLLEKLIPLIFRLQSSSAFRMVGYIVFNHQQDNKHFTGALPSKLPKDSTTEQEAWIRIGANSNQFSWHHSGAPYNPLIYPPNILD